MPYSPGWSSRWRAGLVAAVLGVALVATARPAPAADLLTGLGGPADYGPFNLPGNDDGSTSEIDITGAFPSGLRFFGMTFTTLFVNNNGNISFGGPNGTFTPDPFPVSNLRMIAPWWGDVDTRGGGVPDHNGVYWSITPGRFVATWHNVGYYPSQDNLQNDFQLILTAAGPGVGDFDVEIRYHRCEWTTGSASGGSGGFGGTPAQAGFDAGNLMDYVTLPGSRTMAVLGLCETSNVALPGTYRFAIRDGDVMCPGFGTPCETGRPGVCNPGTIRCRAMASVCVATREPTPEVCNGLDDNCDGTTDEDLGTSTCGSGACVTTVANCAMGRPQTCAPATPQAEWCNGVDDDCNGRVDDLPPAECGIGACHVSIAWCINGDPRPCAPGTPTPEVCNAIDDDCNGQVDENLPGCMAQPDVVVVPEAGTDAGDAGPDGCVGYRCDPRLRLNGRAGPFGCGCRVETHRGSAGYAGALALLGVALAATRKRRRTSGVGTRQASVRPNQR